MIHKHKHLKDEYGDPPQCSKCKTTFVNAICLEAHMETHELGEWTHKCNLCCAIFHDKVLLTSHEMGHGVPLAPVSTIDRSRSQLQHSNMRTINALARKTVASAIESLNKPLSDSQEELQLSEDESVKSETSILPRKNDVPLKAFTCETSSPQKVTTATLVSTSMSTVSTTVTTTPSMSLSTTPISSVVSPPPGGPVSYVKLIPVQLIPTNPVPSSQTGTPTPGVITGPTTAFISVPVNFVGTNETSTGNPVFSQLFDPTAGAVKLAVSDPTSGAVKLALCNTAGSGAKVTVPDPVSDAPKSAISDVSSDTEKIGVSSPTPVSSPASIISSSASTLSSPTDDAVKLDVPTATGDSLKLATPTSASDATKLSISNAAVEEGKKLVSSPSGTLKLTALSPSHTGLKFSASTLTSDSLKLTPLSPSSNLLKRSPSSDVLKLTSLSPSISPLKLAVSTAGDAGKLVTTSPLGGALKLATSSPQMDGVKLRVCDNRSLSNPSNGTIKLTNAISGSRQLTLSEEKQCKKKALPNLIPISIANIPKIKKEVEDEEESNTMECKLESQESPSLSNMDNLAIERKAFITNSGSEMHEGMGIEGELMFEFVINV